MDTGNVVFFKKKKSENPRKEKSAGASQAVLEKHLVFMSFESGKDEVTKISSALILQFWFYVFEHSIAIVTVFMAHFELHRRTEVLTV